MVDHGVIVGGALDVHLDGVVCRDGGAHRRFGILDDATRRVVQSAMGDRSRRQPGEAVR